MLKELPTVASTKTNGIWLNESQSEGSLHHRKSGVLFTLVRVLIGVVLLIAAGMKAHQLISGYVPSPTSVPGIPFLTSPSFQLLNVEIELLIGLWLISGLYKRLAACFTIVYFLLLSGVSGYLIVAGSDCCCFGRLVISPWFTFVFDVFSVATLCLLLSTTDFGNSISSHQITFFATLSAFLFFGILVFVSLPKYRVIASVNDDLGGEGELVVLDVEGWKLKPLPILDQIDIGDRLKQGSCLIVLYHTDCPRCNEVIKHYESMANTIGTAIVLLEIPHLSGYNYQQPFRQYDKFMYAKLSRSKRWVVSTPIVLELNDGVVVRVITTPTFP